MSGIGKIPDRMDIANQLDMLDGKKDALIKADVWNAFIKNKGGKKVQHDISTLEATKKIGEYLNRASAQTKKSKAELQKQWYNDNKGLVVERSSPLSFSNIIASGVKGVTGNKSARQKNIENLIKIELSKRGIKESDIDMSYWSSRIENVSSEYDIPAEILTSIISRETRFQKNQSGGAMQQTLIAIQDFFPGKKGSWNEVYKQLDPKLLNDILYKKDASGKFLKDKSGHYILKYKTPEALLGACSKDDELSMKVGALTFKMLYVKAAAKQKYGKATYANIPSTIKDLKNGAIKPNKTMNQIYIADAVKNYNGSKLKISYQKDVVDSLRIERYNYQTPIIRKTT